MLGWLELFRRKGEAFPYLNEIQLSLLQLLQSLQSHWIRWNRETNLSVLSHWDSSNSCPTLIITRILPAEGKMVSLQDLCLRNRMKLFNTHIEKVSEWRQSLYQDLKSNIELTSKLFPQQNQHLILVGDINYGQFYCRLCSKYWWCMVKLVPTHGNIHNNMGTVLVELNRDCDSLSENDAHRLRNWHY